MVLISIVAPLSKKKKHLFSQTRTSFDMPKNNFYLISGVFWRYFRTIELPPMNDGKSGLSCQQALSLGRKP